MMQYTPIQRSLISIVVTEDHAMVRRGMKPVLLSEPGLHWADEAGDGPIALEPPRRSQPDVWPLEPGRPLLDEPAGHASPTRRYCCCCVC